MERNPPICSIILCETCLQINSKYDFLFEPRFYYVALAGLELDIYTSLASNLERCACLCLGLNMCTSMPSLFYMIFFLGGGV